MNGNIELKYNGQFLGDPSTDEPGGGGRAKWVVGHKATKTNMNCKVSSLAFQDTLMELMVQKEEPIDERQERRHEKKEAITKRFVDLQMRALEVEVALAKSRLVEA
jgi:hypothetical protein